MVRRLAVAAVLAATATTVVLVRRRPRSPFGQGLGGTPRSGWLAVTVLGAPDDVLPGGRVPAPVARLGGGVELEARLAPGDKGTELRARFRPDGAHTVGATGARDQDTARRGRLRAALREAKQLIEVGEVLRVDPVPHGRRSATPTGALVDAATARSNEWGVL